MPLTIFSFVIEFFSLICNRYLHMNKVDFGLEHSLQLYFPLACFFSSVLFLEFSFTENFFGLMHLYFILVSRVLQCTQKFLLF